MISRCPIFGHFRDYIHVYLGLFVDLDNIVQTSRKYEHLSQSNTT